MAEGGISAGMDSFSDFLRDTPSLALTESDTESTNSLSSQIEAVSFDQSSDNQEPEVIGVVLMGKTGAGKSYLGNHLLKQGWFQPSSSLSSCTSECQSGERLLHGHTKLRVIDTPGLFDTDVTVSENMNKILSLFECLHCVDIFLLVVRVDVRFGKEEKEALQWLKDHFGENLNDFAVIILNNHGYKPKDKEALVREAPEILRTIIADCDERCVLVQYNASNVVGENKDVDAILAIIKTTVRRNNGRRYTHKMHGEAKMEYEEKVKRLEEQSKKKERALEERLENMQKENDELQKYKQLVKEKEDLSSRMNLLLSLIPPEKLDEAKDIIKDNENVTGQFNERGEKQTTQNTSILGLACKVRGKISDDNEATIRNNWIFLIDNIKDHIPTLMERLFQKEVFEHEDMEKIEKKIRDEDNRAGAAMLLKTMMKSGPDAYQRFVKCLKETGFTAVVEKLQDAVKTLVKRSTAPVSDRSSIQHSPKLPNSPSTPEISELHQYDMKRSTAPVSDRSSTQHSSARDRTPIIPFDSQSSNGYTSDLINQLPHQSIVDSPEFDSSMRYPKNDNGIHSPTRRHLSTKGAQSITLNLISNPSHNQSSKNQLGNNSFESRIGKVSREAYQPKEQKYDYPLTYHSPEQSKNTPSPNTSLYQQRRVATLVTPEKYDHPLTQCPPKQPNNTVSPHTYRQQLRPRVLMVTPEKDLPKEYSGHERIRTSSIDPPQVKRSTAPVSDRSSIQHSPKLPNSPSTPEISELHQYDMKRSTAPVSDRSSTQHSSARDRTPIIPFNSQSSNGYTSDLINQLPHQSIVDSPEFDSSMRYPKNDNGIHSPTRRYLSTKGAQSITLNLISNPFHNQSSKNQLGNNSFESRIGKVSREAYQPKEQKYDCPLTYHSPEQSKNTPSPNTSLYQQRRVATLVTPEKYDHPLTQCPPKQPNNTVSPHTYRQQLRPRVLIVTPEKDLPKEYSGHERIRTSSIDPLQGRNVTELGEFGNHCKVKIHAEDAHLHGKNQVENDIPDNEDKRQDLNPLAEEFTPTPTEDESFNSCFQYLPTTSVASRSTTNQPYEEGEDLPLHHAAIHCKDENKFMAILEENSEDILKDDHNGKTPLDLAYYSKFTPINKIKMIVSKGFTEAKALFKICQTAPTALIEMMFDKRIHDRMNDADREAVINLCSLLLDGKDITCKTEHNKTLLYIACLYSNIESVKYLLDKGCSISVDYTEEPLLFTCCRSSIQPDLKIQLLKSRGADLNIMDGNSKTLLHEACENGTSDCVRYLIAAELDVNACTTDENYSPLHYCLRTRIHPGDKIKLLVASDALSSDTFSNELLNTACMYSDIYVTKYILDLCESRDLQFNVNYVNNQGETPIYFCCISKILPVRKIKLFESKGSRLDGTYPHGQTLLHAACEHGKLECTEYLLQSGLDVNYKDVLGHSPLFYCYNSLEEPINKMKLLMEYGAKLNVEGENIRRAVLDRVTPK